MAEVSEDLPINTGNPSLDEKIKEWLRFDKNENSIAAMKQLVRNNDIAELEKLLMHRLKFGTAGLRGCMGPGYAAMNDLVVIQTSQGLAKYLKRVDPNVEKRGIVIGYDGRHNSERFARFVAICFIQEDIRTYLYPQMTPTPFVPFGVVQLGCSAGVMITASHNPKEDNGYKVYSFKGAQIIPPMDQHIQQFINQNLEPWNYAWEIHMIERNPLYIDPMSIIEGQYYNAMSDSIFDRETNIRCPIKFTFTAMHGVSHQFMLKAFKVCGFQRYVPVKEQMKPDPEFPTVIFPNPEEGRSALDLSFRTADAKKSSIILANDPDADRLAVAEKLPSGEWKVFTGNEIGALLGWWLWFCYKHKNPKASGENVNMISSTVSSKILKAIAEKEGFKFVETLTGFKWMGNKSQELKQRRETVLFAFEEAIGYMCGTKVLDKDGIIAAMHVAQLAAYARSQELSLFQQLQEIYKMYGFHVSSSSYYICHSQPSITAMFTRLRNFGGSNKYPEALNSYKIQGVRDLTTGYDSTQQDNKAILPTSSSSQMITFYFENGCVATLRTSGTEPKVKYYAELCSQADESEWPNVEAELEHMVQLVIEKWMEPEKNEFIPKAS